MLCGGRFSFFYHVGVVAVLILASRLLLILRIFLAESLLHILIGEVIDRSFVYACSDHFHQYTGVRGEKNVSAD